jgi:hypothetical protein
MFEEMLEWPGSPSNPVWLSFAFICVSIDLTCLHPIPRHMYQTFFDVGATMEAMINEGGDTETQRATQVDTQTTLVDNE